VLNKCDLVEGQPPAPATWAPLLDIGAPFVTCSAKTGDRVVEAFRTAANAILRRGV
jgi:hypothetical protein